MRLPALGIRLAIAMTLATLSPGHAQQSDGNEQEIQKKITEHWLNVSRDYAKTYAISPLDRPNSPFKLYEHVIFQHIQVVRGNDIGAVHLWIHEDNRPAAIGTVFAWTISNNSRMLFNELHSLAEEPIETTQDGRPLWTSRSPGTSWRPVPDGPLPQESPRRRQLQAKQIAKKFTSYMVDFEQKRWELRRIPTPIYEYEVKNDPRLGGALFAFCRGTDIETLLLLAVCDEEGPPRWEFTCAKFIDYEPHILYNGQDVWEPFPDEYMKDGNPHFWGPVGAREMPQIEIDFRR